jgi:photosystem II stability/assembly factor-like uncharacterized protein
MRMRYQRFFFLFSLFILLVPTSSHAAEWSNQDISTPEAIEGIDSYGESLVMAIGTSGAVYVSTNGGNTWTTVDLPDFGAVYDIEVVSANSAFVVGKDLEGATTASGLIYKSTDGGSTWSEVLKALPFGSTIYDLHMYNSTHGWASAKSGAVYKTTDGGASWTLLAPGVSTDLYRTKFVSKLTGYAVGGNGTIVKTTDGGSTWSDLSIGGSYSLWAADFITSSVGWVGGYNMFYKTTNGGTTWTPITVNGTTPSVYDIDVRSATSVTITTNEGIFETTDGSTWTEASDFSSYWTSIYVPKVYYQYSSSAIWVGTNEGDIFWLEQEDTTSPTLSPLTPTSATVGSSTAFSVTATDDTGVDSCTLYINGTNAGSMSASGSTFSLSYTFSIAGSYAMYVVCLDDLSNSTTGSTISVNVVDTSSTTTTSPETTEPTVESTAPTTAPESEATTNPSQEAEPGSLIKLPCEADVDVNDVCKAVYYYSNFDHKRHAFPNEKVFFTWYEDFDDVQIVGSEFMSSLTLGSNITYHPGTRMVKFQSVRTVYAVAAGGELRAIDSEETAIALYGDTWNKQIDDISDAFYGNYTFGEDINSATDYDPDEEYESIDTIDDDLEAGS